MPCSYVGCHDSCSPCRKRLIAVKGVGEWTVDMFMIFQAHRPNVFPVGDLAVVKGVQVCWV